MCGDATPSRVTGGGAQSSPMRLRTSYLFRYTIANLVKYLRWKYHNILLIDSRIFIWVYYMSYTAFTSAKRIYKIAYNWNIKETPLCNLTKNYKNLYPKFHTKLFLKYRKIDRYYVSEALSWRYLNINKFIVTQFDAIIYWKWHCIQKLYLYSQCYFLQPFELTAWIVHLSFWTAEVMFALN